MNPSPQAGEPATIYIQPPIPESLGTWARNQHGQTCPHTPNKVLLRNISVGGTLHTSSSPFGAATQASQPGPMAPKQRKQPARHRHPWLLLASPGASGHATGSPQRTIQATYSDKCSSAFQCSFFSFFFGMACPPRPLSSPVALAKGQQTHHAVHVRSLTGADLAPHEPFNLVTISAFFVDGALTSPHSAAFLNLAIFIFKY